MGVGITGRKNGKIIQAVTIMTRGLPLVNTMMKKRIKILFFFLCKMPIDKLVSMWYNSSGSTGPRRQAGPDFPIGYPIWKISNTSSDFSYAPGFPVKQLAPAGPIGSPYAGRA